METTFVNDRFFIVEITNSLDGIPPKLKTEGEQERPKRTEGLSDTYEIIKDLEKEKEKKIMEKKERKRNIKTRGKKKTKTYSRSALRVLNGLLARLSWLERKARIGADDLLRQVRALLFWPEEHGNNTNNHQNAQQVTTRI